MDGNQVRELLKPIEPHEALKKFTINLTDNAKVDYDPVFGARRLKRAIEGKLVDEIAMRIIEGTVKPGDRIQPNVKDGKILL